MTDFNFDPNTMTRAYAQRKALTEEENVRPKARPKGIASKPDDGNTDTSSDEPNFYDKMLDKLLGYFSSEDDANKVLSDKTPDRQDTQTSYEDMFGGLSQETLDAVEQAKQKRMGPADRRDVDVVEKTITEEAEPKPLVDPKDIAPDLQRMDPEGIEDMPPLPKPATDDGGLMSRDTPTEKGETTTDTGLMSKPLTDDDMGLPEDPLPDLITYSTTVDALYTDFTDGGQEGTEAHIGLDAQNITLPAGIVAEGLKYDGVAVDQGSNTITAANFDKDKLDTSGAFFKIGSTKIKRSDYTTDVDFSKAVLTGFEDAAKKKAGTDWDKMPDAAKKAMLKVGWNKGAGWLGGSTAGKAYKELAKTTPSASNLYPKILTGSTLAPKDDGTIQGASIGIAKARADAMNLLKDTLSVKEITKVIADNTGTNTAFKYYDKEGTLVHTEQTDRAVTLYANGSNEKVEKNAAGEW